MAKDVVEQQSSFPFLEKDHRTIEAQSERLLDLLIDFRYDGPAAMEGHVRQSKELIDDLTRKFREHLKADEEVFSFIENHVPKLEQAIRMLGAEHKQIHVNFEVLEFLMYDLPMEKSEFKRLKILEKIREKGTYLVYLIQHHIHAEEAIVYRAIEESLSHEEREEMGRRIRKSLPET